jgi:hypothetical protein
MGLVTISHTCRLCRVDFTNLCYTQAYPPKGRQGSKRHARATQAAQGARLWTRAPPGGEGPNGQKDPARGARRPAHNANFQGRSLFVIASNPWTRGFSDLLELGGSIAGLKSGRDRGPVVIDEIPLKPRAKRGPRRPFLKRAREAPEAPQQGAAKRA